MKKMIALLMAAVLLLTAVGCGGSAGNAQTPATVWVSYEEDSGKVKNEKNKDIFIYSWQQPVISGQSEAAKIINTKLDNATTAFVYGSGGVQELTEMAKMDWNENWFTCYALERTVSTARIDSAVVSFRYTDYVFTGGVHGYTGEYGITYNIATGDQMSLGDLTSDEASLMEFCREYIVAVCEDEGYAYRETLLPGYQNSLDSVLKNWCLTDTGLQFIAQPYVIAAYAAGTLYFTIPYAELTNLLQKQWQPGRLNQGSGDVYISSAADRSSADTFVVDTEGQPIALQVRGYVYDFSLEGLNSYKTNGVNNFYVTEQHLYSPELTDGTQFIIQLAPEAVPNAMIRYKTDTGTEHQYFISASDNGSAVLTAVETLVKTDD